MSDVAIHVEGISKQYHIGKLQTRSTRSRYRTLRDVVAEVFWAPFRRASKLLQGQATSAAELDETIWAVKDVSFKIKSGEVVGIIGRNGAGKSTLLKILSRITEPTSGFVDIYGRVGSLLEVGTGFHPELTGRENIYLNGTILGMKRVEIDRKFDEIVAFSEVEKFIDTPVKHYSSGMLMRLAFAVAAHLEPEILLVDEVLAVGDSVFQRKCLDKMEEVGQQGRTVLFVSHNMPAITRLCERTILIDGGRVLHDGPSSQVVGIYLNSGLGTTAAREWPNVAQAPGNKVVRLRAVRVKTEDGQIKDVMDIRRPVAVEMVYDVLQPGYALWPCFVARNEEGASVFSAIDLDPTWRGQPRPVGHYVSVAWIPGNLLAEGTMIIGAQMRTIHPNTLHFNEHDTVAFQVVDSIDGDSARGDWGGQMSGIVRPRLEWNTQFSPNGTKSVVTIREEVNVGGERP